MRVVIVGGGIAAVYAANALVKSSVDVNVMILSDESLPPYDRIHLCSLINQTKTTESIRLELDPKVKVELNQPVLSIDTDVKRVFSEHAVYGYDKLIIATGSIPKALFDIRGCINATTFRNQYDSCKIADGVRDKNVVIVGAGPIALELLDTLSKIPDIRSITILVRNEYLYSPDLDLSAIRLIESVYQHNSKIKIQYNDEILTHTVEGDRIVSLETRQGTIEDLFLIFGVGIMPNIAFAKSALDARKGILVDERMCSSDPFVYVIGEAAELRSDGFIAGRVKECTLQGDVAVANILGEERAFVREVSIDGLKVGAYLFADLVSPAYRACENESVVMRHEDRIDQFILKDNRLVRFIGINTRIDLGQIKSVIEKGEPIDPGYLFSNKIEGTKGKLICSCANVHEQELVELIEENAITAFADLKAFSEAGRVCGRCRQEVIEIIAKTPVDPERAAFLKEARRKEAEEKQHAAIRARIEKFNRLHPANSISTENLEKAIESFELGNEFNQWVSMVTASMRLHPNMEDTVREGVMALNKIPIVWLELADCSGNSEGFIKAAHPKIDELIFNYVSLDYHELLMSAAGDQSESVLEGILEKDSGNYILIVEGAVPLGLDGKFLRIGPKGETGLELLRRCAKNAKAVLAVGSCAFDGGVVAAKPNPTGAVGVTEALGRKDVINLPGCPVNPINIVGTLLHLLMFDEMPSLDEKNRPTWAYGFRIHDNCERRGHYDLGEFVLEWGDEGAKKGWCLFKMGCKGPYAHLNCSLVKFNEGTSWPVQSGHGCFACAEGKIAFDVYANQRPLSEEETPT